mmetsp:Transcript_9407/g.26979  ORF Transcript_9407/g.26979 Transcript_9407/m.26979 type:complete len:232 (-) Transcript_9407:232-927(-)
MEPKVFFLVPGKLACACVDAAEVDVLTRRVDGSNVRFVSSGLHKSYRQRTKEFGPVDISIIHRFCNAFVHRIRTQPGALVYLFEKDPKSQTNASLLLSSLMVLYFGWSPKKAATFFKDRFQLNPYTDAFGSKEQCELTVEDCLVGLQHASDLEWYSPSNFDLQIYRSLSDPWMGDITQICPKIFVFKGPLSPLYPRDKHEVAHPPSSYIPLLQSLGVTTVIRFNDQDTYDR